MNNLLLLSFAMRRVVPGKSWRRSSKTIGHKGKHGLLLAKLVVAMADVASDVAVRDLVPGFDYKRPYA